MNEFSFELFTGQGSKFNVAVSISKPGILSFTSGMYKKYELYNYRGVQLLFDKDKKVIAMKLHAEQSKDMFSLRHRKDNKGGFIACKSYIFAYDIDKNFGKRYLPEEIEHPELGKIFIVDLNKPLN